MSIQFSGDRERELINPGKSNWVKFRVKIVMLKTLGGYQILDFKKDIIVITRH